MVKWNFKRILWYRVKRNIAVEKLEKSVQAKEQNMQKLKQYEDEISKLTYTQRMKQARHQFLIETEKKRRI